MESRARNTEEMCSLLQTRRDPQQLPSYQTM